MKRFQLYSIGIGLSLMFLSFFGRIETMAKSSKWKLVWSEEFKGNTFDTRVWSKIPRGHVDWNRNMSDFDSCYAVKNGNLILRGLLNNCCPDDSAPYITGGLYTKGKKTFENGRLEIRAKLGEARGAWPAIWLLPENGTWPEAGEIDIMEHLNHDSIAYQTVHSYYTYTLQQEGNPPHSRTGPIKRHDYNVYAVELYKDSISFFINDKHTFTYPRIQTDKEGQFPYARPFYLLIDMQLGGAWVGKVTPEDLPVEMKIDWVRFYKRK